MNDRHLTEGQARALWERAAQLQAEASTSDLAPEQEDRDIEVESEGDYSVEVVRRSATEAGIAPEFVERALEELAAEEQPRGRVDRWADAYLGEGPRTIRVARRITAPPAEVYAAMQRVLPKHPFGLTLEGVSGGSPLEGGVLTFGVPSLNVAGTSTPTGAIFDIRHWADIKELRFRLLPVEGKAGATELEVMASLAHSRRVNYWAGNSVSFIVAAFGAVVGGAIGAAAIGATGGAGVLGVFSVSGATGVGGFLGMGRLWRPIFRAAVRKGTAGMDKILGAIEVDLQTGGAFTVPAPKPSEAQPGLEILKDLGL